jgi:hypothetical protein
MCTDFVSLLLSPHNTATLYTSFILYRKELSGIVSNLEKIQSVRGCEQANSTCFYTRGIELSHPWVLLSVEGPRAHPLDLLRVSCILFGNHNFFCVFSFQLRANRNWVEFHKNTLYVPLKTSEPWTCSIVAESLHPLC